MQKTSQSSIRRTAVACIAAGVVVAWLAVIAAPASAGPPVTVTPSMDLADGQTVSVSGTGQPADSPIVILQCNNADAAGVPFQVGATGNCDGPRAISTTSDSNGSFGPVDFVVHQASDKNQCIQNGVFDCYIRATIVASGITDPARASICFGAAGTCAAQVTTTSTTAPGATTTTTAATTSTTAAGATTTSTTAASATTSTTAAASVSTTTAAAGAGGGTGLPITGAGIDLMTLVAVLLLAGGSGLWALGARTARRS